MLLYPNTNIFYFLRYSLAAQLVIYLLAMLVLGPAVHETSSPYLGNESYIINQFGEKYRPKKSASGHMSIDRQECSYDITYT